MWVNFPKGHEAALTWGWRLHFFVYQDRKLKFGMHIAHAKLSRMICIFIWVNSPKGREVTLTSDRRPHFYIYQDRKLKFGPPYTPPQPPRRGGGRPQGVTPLIFRVFFNPRTIEPFVCKVGRCNYHHSYKQLNTAPLWHFILWEKYQWTAAMINVANFVDVCVARDPNINRLNHSWNNKYICFILWILLNI